MGTKTLTKKHQNHNGSYEGHDIAQDLAMYLHACAGYPVVTTWCQAIANGNYCS
jgi:hypothetical protein